jgi:tetratricopeptide (TPR) repeat protein
MKKVTGLMGSTAALLLGAAIFLSCAGTQVPNEPPAEETELSPEAEELVYAGVRAHDRGDYETAIDYYNQALELSPGSPVIYYEMAFSYMYMGDSAKALELAETGIVKGERNTSLTELAGGQKNVLEGLYDLKGSALDNLGRGEEAIQVYLEAIDRFGVSDTSLLYYNLGLTYYRLEKRDEARKSLVKGLLINPFHPSSNFLLGKICVEENRKTQAFYSMCYFLLLEPDSSRSQTAYDALKTLLAGNEQIGISDSGSFTAADLLISLAFALDDSGDPNRSDTERFEAKLGYLFSALGELKNGGKLARTEGDELWWDFYAPLFSDISNSEHMEAFSRYISMSGSEESSQWLKTHNIEVEAFFEWLNSD